MVANDPVNIDFRILAESASVGLTILDESLRFMYVNPRMLDVLGYDRDELNGISFEEITHPDDVAEIMQDIGELRKNKSGTLTMRRRFSCKNGDYLWTRYSLSHTGAMVAQGETYIGVMENSELASVPDSDFRSVFQDLPEIFFITDSENMLVDFNKSFVNTTGYSQKELLGKDLTSLVTEDSQATLNKVFASVQKGDECRNYDVKFFTKDGRTLNFQIATIPRHKDGEFDSAGSIGRDVTDLKRGSMELNRINKQLIEKNRELEQIVYVTSHDLRSPLVNIQGFTQELEISIQDLKKLLISLSIPETYANEIEYIVDNEFPESIGYINSGIYKMDRLLKGLLTISRIGRRPLEKIDLDMNELVRQLVNSFEFQLKQKEISIHTEPLPPCKADESQIMHVLSNLLENAIKYMRPNVAGEIRISGKEMKSAVRYSVSDNGMGIARDKHERVFEIFYRDEQNESGEGLGLTIVRKLIEKHLGDVTLDSTLNKGTVVSFTIPK